AMYISNNCILPKDWTTETLMKPHKSMPFNPSIANAFIALDILRLGDVAYRKYAKPAGNLVHQIRNIPCLAMT
ncbi:MAG: hypothetical protein LUE87_10190, partial [Lachnospiraceae bacterium]|nr:hypothetical protein [Lachnospiraceae bacterium]